MRNLLLVVLSFATGCGDGASAPSATKGVRGDLAAAPAPSLARSIPIEKLDEAPPEARETLVRTLEMIAGDRKADFLAIVSSGGFATDKLALCAEQVETELLGRTVAELTELPCAADGACVGVVAMRDVRTLDLEVRGGAHGRTRLAFVREDSGAWAITGAHALR
jgi:hypothetical protein